MKNLFENQNLYEKPILPSIALNTFHQRLIVSDIFLALMDIQVDSWSLL